MQPVIKWGRAWLEDNSFDRRARDVALTAALAHCDLAGQPPTSLPSLQMKHCVACNFHTARHPLRQASSISGKPGLKSLVTRLSRSISTDVQRTGWRSMGRAECRMPRVF